MSKCKECSWDYDLEEYDPNGEIPQIMKEQGLCFRCAFWVYQFRKDSERILEGVLPIITKKFYKSVSGVNPHTHYCLTVGPNNTLGPEDALGYIFNRSGGVITLDGYVFPYNGNSSKGGITHQGDIPINFKRFSCNAKFLTYQEVMQVINFKGVTKVPVEEAFQVKLQNLLIEYKEVTEPLQLNLNPDLKYRYIIKVPREVVEKMLNLNEW